MNATQQAKINYLSVEMPKRLTAVGIDPNKFARIPMAQTLVDKVFQNEMPLGEFIRIANTLTIFSPGIKLQKSRILDVSVVTDRLV